MSLNSHLTSDFSDMINDLYSDPEEQIVYGVAEQMSGDSGYGVVLDGAENPVPVESTITLANGDRVMVMIRNHRATVIANTSTPSATVNYMKSDDGKALIIDQISDYVEDYVGSVMDDAIQSWLNKMFPVGSLIITIHKISPASIYNGKWVLIGEGLTLMSVTEDDEGGTIPGGIYASNIRTVNGVPAHTHSVSGAGTIDTSSNGSHIHKMGIYTTWKEGSILGTDTRNFGIGKNLDGFHDRIMVQASEDLTPAQKESAFYPTEVSTNHTHKVDLSNITIGSSGSGGTVDVTQKHITVYMWRRIS